MIIPPWRARERARNRRRLKQLRRNAALIRARRRRKAKERK